MTDPEPTGPERMSKETRRALHQSFQEDVEARGCLGQALITAFVALLILIAAGIGIYFLLRSRSGH
jgi:hypothetical protein